MSFIFSDILNKRRFLSAVIRKFDVCIKKNLEDVTDTQVIYRHELKNKTLRLSVVLYIKNIKTFENKYLECLLNNISKLKNNEPSWCYRIYIPLNFPERYISMLKNDVEIFTINKINKSEEATLWRLFIIDDDVDFIMCDSDDDVLKYLDIYRSWYYNSHKEYLHIKYFYNNFLWPMSFSSFGIKKTMKPFNSESISKFINKCDYFGCDELFLKKKLYPEIKNKITTYTHEYIDKNMIKAIVINTMIIILIIIFIIILIKKILKRTTNKNNHSS